MRTFLSVSENLLLRPSPPSSKKKKIKKNPSKCSHLDDFVGLSHRPRVRFVDAEDVIKAVFLDRRRLLFESRRTIIAVDARVAAAGLAVRRRLRVQQTLVGRAHRHVRLAGVHGREQLLRTVFLAV